MNPLVSVILPVYNGEQFLAEAIESCVNQTYQNFELIIVNDCSTDCTLQIAEKFVARDKRIKIISNDRNKKLPASLNSGHYSAMGDYLTWISDDNILKKSFLSNLLTNLFSKNVDIVYSNYENIDFLGNILSIQKVGCVSNLIFGNTIGASFLYKRCVFEHLKGYDENLFTVEDYDFWLRASLKFSFYQMDESLIYYRMHSNSLTSQISSDSILKNRFHTSAEKSMNGVIKSLNWKKTSLYLIIAIQTRLSFCFSDYKNNFKQFQEDLDLYRKSIPANKCSSCPKKLDLILRDFLNQGIIANSFSNIVWFLLNQPGVLFNRTYSNFKTLKMFFR